MTKKKPNYNLKKDTQLGMPVGTAANRLRKMVLFNLLVKHGENICFKCNKSIDTVEALSIEHKIPWLDNNIALYWDMNNIAFSHLICNTSTARRDWLKVPGNMKASRDRNKNI